MRFGPLKIIKVLLKNIENIITTRNMIIQEDEELGGRRKTGGNFKCYTFEKSGTKKRIKTMNQNEINS